ncbi:UTP--glucose-1-phosphate uridylyltransferase [Octadecabacter sp. 1_MG-2023]|uniref:UTP--glucose-1-phosphate uridylyltransferase n=1 Tax=unclassified Octadecabacter TaxID=196158 RepID=UPI001C09B29B|nr:MULTISPECIES: UTP--glucose-1-phosphate uridylyltransferase [unclassified Octadecabacter]MBU2994502.1 UTP--glucose-1-phosphate uridylyltransferase [Octadecabacter sp. B2R22]MDO6734205.1 UTP--glucose-1-phosphate uridylyltransferase [Octadecabacter sp. 1_MG-2023]
MSRIRKAVFPVAGMGTRFLPATKSVPKEMLPLIDRPLIQYAVDEARAAGIEEFIFVSAAGKGALEDYFDTAAALEMTLKAKGKTDALAALEPSHMREGALTILRQGRALGLGHAVRQAKYLIGDDPFAVLLPDDVIKGPIGALSQMVEAHRNVGGHMVATMDVPRAATSSYGVLNVKRRQGRVFHARGMVEKPRPDIAPSTQAVVGRYILQPSIFARLADLGPGVGGELQLTDAINADLSNASVTGYEFAGERFDCGSIQGFVQATAAFALDRVDLGKDFAAFMETRKLPEQMTA